MHFMCFALVCPWVGAIMVHEKQHSHLHALGGYPYPHHHTMRVCAHLQGGAGMSKHYTPPFPMSLLETIAAILIILLAFI